MTIRVIWIPGHNGVVGNIRSDELAKPAIIRSDVLESINTRAEYAKGWKLLISSHWQGSIVDTLRGTCYENMSDGQEFLFLK